MGEVNSFESGARKVIPAVLVYLCMGDQILMLHRTGGTGPGARGATDYHLGKWNGLGGKLEQDETPAEAAVREVREESGLALSADRLRMLGLLHFPNFKAHKSEDWVVWLFTADVTAAEATQIRPQGAEGDLHWIPEADLTALNLWAGDRHFIPYIQSRRPFYGTIAYRGDVVERFEIKPI